MHPERTNSERGGSEGNIGGIRESLLCRLDGNGNAKTLAQKGGGKEEEGRGGPRCGAVAVETRGPKLSQCQLGSGMFWQVSQKPKTWTRAFGSPPT